MAIYNALLGPSWNCTTQIPARGDQPPQVQTSTIAFSTVPRNVMAVEVSGVQFAGKNFIGYDDKSNQYWRTEMGNYGGIMRETSTDGVNFSGTSTMGGEWEPVRSVVKVEADGSSTDMEIYTRNGAELTVKSRCTR